MLHEQDYKGKIKLASSSINNYQYELVKNIG